MSIEILRQAFRNSLQQMLRYPSPMVTRKSIADEDGDHGQKTVENSTKEEEDAAGKSVDSVTKLNSGSVNFAYSTYDSPNYS